MEVNKSGTVSEKIKIFSHFIFFFKPFQHAHQNFASNIDEAAKMNMKKVNFLLLTLQRVKQRETEIEGKGYNSRSRDGTIPLHVQQERKKKNYDDTSESFL